MDVAEAIDRARLLQEQGKADEALEVLLAAAKEHDDEDLRGEIAFFYAERGWQRMDESSLADFKEAGAWAELPLALAGEAAIRAGKGEVEEAEKLLVRSLELDPDLPQAHFWMGRLRYARDQHEPALESFSKAAELSPAFGLPHAWRAHTLVKLGRKEEAHCALLEGLRHCPYDGELYVTLGSYYAEANEPAKAKKALRRAVEINRNNLSAWCGLAELAARDGDELEMRKALDAAAAIDREAVLEWAREKVQEVPLFKVYLE